MLQTNVTDNRFVTISAGCGTSSPTSSGTATSWRGGRVDVQPSAGAAGPGRDGINVKVVAAISEELLERQPQAYQDAVLPAEAKHDMMVVSTGTRRS